MDTLKSLKMTNPTKLEENGLEEPLKWVLLSEFYK